MKEHYYGGESSHYPGEAEGMNDSSTYIGGAKGELVHEKSKGFDHRLDVLNKKVS